MQDYELVVVSYRSRPQIEEMLAGLPLDTPVVIVDNASNTDGLREWVAQRPRMRYLDGGGRGFAHAVNLGVRTSTYDVVIFVNPDAHPTPAVLDSLASDVRADVRCASSAALTVDSNGMPEMGNGGWEPSVRRAFAHTLGIHKIAPRWGIWARPEPGEDIALEWTTAACLAVRRDLFAELGGYDEGFFVYCEDIAFGRTVRQHGMYQRVRTDLLVRHDNGNSGAPSLEMLRLRGAMLARYLGAHHRRGASRLMVGTLAAGFAARAAQRRVRGDRAMAQQHLSYTRGLLTARAYVGGREVTATLPRPNTRHELGPEHATAS